jgi:predicted phosphodiesterase
MAIGLLSDLHGNLDATRAVVTDGTSLGVDEWWVLGDVVALGPDPVATLELVRSLPGVRIISGNTERYTLTGDRPPPFADDVRAEPELLGVYTDVTAGFAWTRGALAATGWIDEVTGWPAEVRAVLPDGTRLLGVHASPGRDDGPGITPDRPEDELAADLAGAGADLVCAGHTHRPTDRRIGPVHAVNLGSVSNPITDDPRASYVVVHADAHGHRVEHRRVAYDHEAFVERIHASSHPAADYLSSFQLGRHVQHRADVPGAPAVG